MNNQLFQIYIKTSQRLKQICWFSSCYSEIYPENLIYLYFQNYIPKEVVDFTTIRSNKVKTILYKEFFEAFTVEEIRNFEAFNYIAIPFKNKMLPNVLNTFLSNLDKIKDKSKIICILDKSNFEEFNKIGSVINFCQNNKVTNFIISGFGPKSFGAIKVFLEKNNLNLIDFSNSTNYQIDDYGNILDSKTKKTLSTIYKHPGFLIFK